MAVPEASKAIPPDSQQLQHWVEQLSIDATTNPQPLHPTIKEFKDLIETDAELHTLFSQMFSEVPHVPPYDKDPFDEPQVRDYNLMLTLFNAILTRAPEFDTCEYVGFPINAILRWPMGTPSGSSVFLNPKVNAQVRKMLDDWARFLSSEESASVLNADPDRGWFGRSAMESLPDFDALYVCDPQAAHHGFKSWDHFFTREFKPGSRPVASPDDPNIIVNPCESSPYRITHGVQAHDTFWLKSQPYSLNDMLAGDPLTPEFVDGTVYQGFLSPLSYHRWHSPVDGKVTKAYKVPGTYYSQSLAQGFDPVAAESSMGYLTAVATRALVFIEAVNERIGLMCFMAVGMAEVSTCDITVREGQNVRKGEQLGMFHYGGSTHCLLFRPETRLVFNMHGQTPGPDSTNILVNEEIAMVLEGY